MKFLFLTFFLSTSIFAQIDTGTNTTTDCDNTTFAAFSPTFDNVYECRDVTITEPIPGTPFSTADIADSSMPLKIKATGNVTIESIDFFGEDAIGNIGGSGGPGGGAGGSYFGSASAGSPAGSGGKFPSNPANCPGAGDDAEGSGGGGGSLVDEGEDGWPGVLTAGAGTTVAGGLKGTQITFNINSFTFAGAGGGSGEAACENGAPTGTSPGGGGGGGGGLKIAAAGDITITGTLNFSGGNGGDVATIDGAGGGGSGGIIVLQALGQINLAGSTFLAELGTGGTNSTPSTEHGDGGDGGDGIIILEDLDGAVSGGTFSPTPTVRTVGGGSTGGNGGSSSKLSSDISCGSISKTSEQNHNNLFMILVGFGFVSLISFLSRFKRIKVY